MKHSQLQTIGCILCVTFLAACTPADADADGSTRDAASTTDTGADGAPDTESIDVGPAAVAAIAIAPEDPTIELNEALKLEATAVDADGAQLGGHSVTWTSSDATVVRVNEYANVVGVEVGTATITATIGDVSGSVLVTVVGNPVETVEVVPKRRTLQIGEQVELSVFLEDINRVSIDDEREIAFSSSAPDVATASSGGLITGVSAGSATITATAEGKSDTADITVEATSTSIDRVEVTPPSARLIRGDTTQLQVAVYEAGDSQVVAPSVVWTSSAPNVAAVDADGLVEAVGEGSATIIAASGGKSDTAGVEVTFSLEALVRGGAHTCGLIQGAAFCWGDNDRGQLGRGSASAGAPVARVSGGHTFVALATGDVHTCALTLAGDAYCWGANDDGRLGDATSTERHTPTQVQGGHTFTAISAGARHTCALDTQGTSWCWGANGYGQLGDGSTSGSRVPVQVGGSGYTHLVAGDGHTCALSASNEAYCWGRNHRGQLGNGATSDRHVPVQVLGGYEFAALSLGKAHSCGLGTAGSTACWGANDAGQIGDGTTTERHTPILASAPVSFSRLSSGSRHTCALGPGGEVFCWGANDAGQLGLGATGGRSRPTEVSSTASFSDVHAGGSGSCGLDVAGKPYCWGAPSGDDSPMRVAGF